MEYVLLPICLVVACSALACFVVVRGQGTSKPRIATAAVLLCVSHVIVGLGVLIYKDLDDNSYYASTISTILEETIDALRSNEPDFANRLETFTSQQQLSYASRGNILENARRFRTDGIANRSKTTE